MGSNGTAVRPARLAVTTMSPPPRARSAGSAACMPNTTPSTFTAMARRYRSRSKSSPTPHPVATPALRNAMSRPPNRSTAAETAAWLSPGSRTSHRTNTPPVSSATRSPPSATSATTTDAPRDASRRAAAAPNPPAPPVISATLPSNRSFAVDTRSLRTSWKDWPARPRVPYGRSPHCIAGSPHGDAGAQAPAGRTAVDFELTDRARDYLGLLQDFMESHVYPAEARAAAGRRGAQDRGPEPGPVEPVPARCEGPRARPVRRGVRAARRAHGAEPGDRAGGHELLRARHREHGGPSPVRLAGAEGSVAPAPAGRRDPQLLRHDRARRGQLRRHEHLHPHRTRRRPLRDQRPEVVDHRRGRSPLPNHDPDGEDESGRQPVRAAVHGAGAHGHAGRRRHPVPTRVRLRRSAWPLRDPADRRPRPGREPHRRGGQRLPPRPGPAGPGTHPPLHAGHRHG